MTKRWVALGVTLMVLTFAGSLLAQPRCKAPKRHYQGKCRYADEIEKLQQQQHRPAPKPEPQPQPAAEPEPPTEPPPMPLPEPEPPTPMEPSPSPPPEPASSVPAEVPEALSPRSDASADDIAPEPFWGWQRVTALTLGGLAVVGTGVGIGLVVDATQTYDGARCDEETNFCADDADIARRDAAFDKATGATIAFAVAGGAAAGGLLLWLLAPTEDGAHVGLAAAPNELLVRGRW